MSGTFVVAWPSSDRKPFLRYIRCDWNLVNTRLQPYLFNKADLECLDRRIAFAVKFCTIYISYTIYLKLSLSIQKIKRERQKCHILPPVPCYTRHLWPNKVDSYMFSRCRLVVQYVRHICCRLTIFRSEAVLEIYTMRLKPCKYTFAAVSHEIRRSGMSR